jgi:hypothetical protein
MSTRSSADLMRFVMRSSMIVGEYHGGRVDCQRLLDDLPRVDARAVDRAPEQLVKAEDPVSVVQVEAAENLVLQVTNPRMQEITGIRGATDALPGWQGFRKIPAREFGQSHQHRRPGLADAFQPGEPIRVCFQQRAQPAESSQQSAGSRAGIGAAQNGGQQLDVAHYRRLDPASLAHGKTSVCGVAKGTQIAPMEGCNSM